MDANERRQFVKANHTVVVGYTRRNAPPSMSIVYYTMDGDDILFSTMSERAKAGAVRRLGELSLCILDGQWPPTYIVVDGKAVIDEDPDTLTDVGMKIGAVMAGEPLPDELRPMVLAKMQAEKRVVIRVTPVSTFHSPPVHLHRAADALDAEKMKDFNHGLGARLPW